MHYIIETENFHFLIYYLYRLKVPRREVLANLQNIFSETFMPDLNLINKWYEEFEAGQRPFSGFSTIKNMDILILYNFLENSEVDYTFDMIYKAFESYCPLRTTLSKEFEMFKNATVYIHFKKNNIDNNEDIVPMEYGIVQPNPDIRYQYRVVPYVEPEESCEPTEAAKPEENEEPTCSNMERETPPSKWKRFCQFLPFTKK